MKCLLIFVTFQGRHSLVYDKGSANETWEWVKLSEVHLIHYPVSCSEILAYFSFNSQNLQS
jgi:hypothetical protein